MSAVSIQGSSGAVRTPGNRQLSGPQEAMFHSKGKKGEMERSNYPAKAVWEFYRLIIIPQRHAKLFPKLLRDASAGERSSSCGRDHGGQIDEIRAALSAGQEHQEKKGKGAEERRSGRNQTMHQAAGCRLAAAAMD